MNSGILSFLHSNDLYPEGKDVPQLPPSSVVSATLGYFAKVSYICTRSGEPRVIEWAKVALGSSVETFYKNTAYTFTKPFGSFSLYLYDDDVKEVQKISEEWNTSVVEHYIHRGCQVVMKMEKHAVFSSRLNAAHKGFMKKECEEEGRGLPSYRAELRRDADIRHRVESVRRRAASEERRYAEYLRQKQEKKALFAEKDALLEERIRRGTDETFNDVVSILNTEYRSLHRGSPALNNEDAVKRFVEWGREYSRNPGRLEGRVLTQLHEIREARRARNADPTRLARLKQQEIDEENRAKEILEWRKRDAVRAKIREAEERLDDENSQIFEEARRKQIGEKAWEAEEKRARKLTRERLARESSARLKASLQARLQAKKQARHVDTSSDSD